MRQLAVISGKGGTGKTTITAALATIAQGAVLADCDVDAADLHLILAPHVESEVPFHGLGLARIDPSRCTGCGLCREHCRFGAITQEFDVVAALCEGCGVCDLVCPEGAVCMVERVSGVARMSSTRLGPLSHAQLGIGEEASGLLTTVVRRNAEDLAERHDRSLILVDGPPGIGCPAIAAVAGVDLVLVVTEPTLSGRHDLERAVAMIRHFDLPAAVAVNKSDINPAMTDQVVTWCRSEGIPVVAVLPYDESVTAAMIAGRTVPEHPEAGLTPEIRQMWAMLELMLEGMPR